MWARVVRLVSDRTLGHRPQPVEDPAGKADLPREVLIDVDRVEVAARARVTDGEIPVRRHLELERVARLHEPPLTSSVHVPVTTVSPRWFSDTVSIT